MANKWLTHVKKTMKSHKGKKFGDILKMAKKTYKGGADVSPHSDFGGSADISNSGPGSASPFHPSDAAPVGGRRTRKSRKSRKGGMHMKGMGYGMY
jgi:hypothetical protein